MYAERGPHSGGPSRTIGTVVVGMLCVSLAVAAAPADFPERSPSTRAQAERVLARESSAVADSLSVRIHRALVAGTDVPAPWREAAAVLADAELGPFRVTLAPTVPATTARTEPGMLDFPEARDHGREEAAAAGTVVERVWARTVPVLRDELGIAPIARADVHLSAIAGVARGYTLPARGSGPTRIVLDPKPAGGSAALSRAASRELAFASVTAELPAIDPAWADAFARWLAVRVAGPDPATLDLMTLRRDGWIEGLASDDPVLAAGNALWFAWLDEAIGARAVRVALEELAGSADLGETLERIAFRAAGTSASAMLREFQLWSVLTGSRFDGRHLSFGGRMADADFASDVAWLPAISVHSDAPIAPAGGSVFRIAPDEGTGGMTVRFEGGFDARWGVDVLLRLDDGGMHRVPVALEDGRGEVTVPLSGLDEAILLVRNDGSDVGVRARFTWAALPARDFPFALSRLDARWLDGVSSGVTVDWETSGEHRLLGFDVLRTPAEGGVTKRINPVWIPAIGDPAKVSAYRFLDASASPGRSYLYRVEGVTLEGLRSTTRSVLVTTPDPQR